MSGRDGERVVIVTMRLLALAFAVTGILFIATPDGVIEAIDDAGAWVGDFSPGAGSEQKLWLGLAFAYMVVITGIALVIQADVVRFRPLLLVLAAGKAASSLAAGAFFLLDEDVFVYLLNFLVDGTLVAVALGCWVVAGRVAAPGGRLPVGEGGEDPALPNRPGGLRSEFPPRGGVKPAVTERLGSPGSGRRSGRRPRRAPS